MTVFSSSAPGKILLSGEYAVLDGAPALAAAVNRRCTVTVSEKDGESSELSCPGFMPDRIYFDFARKGGIEWRSGHGQKMELFETIFAAIVDAPSKALSITIDSGEQFDSASGNKLGLGSSAAITVALSSALNSLQQQAIGVDKMIEIHRDFQQGKGSGVDVAACWRGGIICYRMSTPSEIIDYRWPTGLQYAVLWSGAEARTSEKIVAFERAATDRKSRAQLCAASEGIAASWQTDSAAAILQQFAGYSSVLKRFSDDHDLGIFAGGHQELAELAAETGVVYKPCGAGGGDVGLALAMDSASITKFCKAAKQHGFSDLELKIDANGVTGDSVADE